MHSLSLFSKLVEERCLHSETLSESQRLSTKVGHLGARLEGVAQDREKVKEGEREGGREGGRKEAREGGREGGRGDEWFRGRGRKGESDVISLPLVQKTTITTSKNGAVVGNLLCLNFGVISVSTICLLLLFLESGSKNIV